MPTDNELLAQAEARLASEKRAEAGAKLADLGAPVTVAGQTMRPMSAGVLRVLESIDHPLVRGGSDTTELGTAEIVTLAYCLAAPVQPRDLVALAAQGRAAFQTEADVWAFGLLLDDLTAMAQSATKQAPSSDGGGSSQAATAKS